MNRIISIKDAIRRIRLVALHAVGEALHLRIAHLFFVIGLVPIASVGWLREFNFGTAESKFIIDVGQGALGLGGMLLSVLATVQLFHSELEGRGVQMLLTRGLSPIEYLWGKFAGMAVLMAWFVFSLTFVTAMVLIWRVDALASPILLVDLIAGAALSWLKLLVAVAMTMLVCSYARSGLFAAVVGILLVVMSHLRHLLGHGMETASLLARVLPDFQLFDPERIAAVGDVGVFSLVFGSAVYALIYVLLYGMVAGWFLRRREY